MTQIELADLIQALSDPAAYPFPAEAVAVRHTHISVVFLVGRFVYKIKKPLALGFLDFGTLEKRRHFCEEEVRLNRRLAPTVYVGVVPITRSAERLEVEGRGEVVEWAVKMERLPEGATLLEFVRRGEIGAGQMEDLARKLAAFHAHADHGEHVAAFGRFDVVARNARENFDQSAPHIGTTLSTTVFDRLRALTEEALAGLRPLIEARAARGVPRDTHGDLHLDHVYLFPHRKPPADLVIIDCIEFNERFRFADPVSDIAFLVMDLIFQGRPDLARVFSDAYFQAAGDDDGRTLLPFYTAYRAAVRGKVEGFELAEKEIPSSERASALTRGRAHWLLALRELEEPRRKPCLILVGGLPGTGKSTLAHYLSQHANLCLIRSDVVRKELAGLPATGSAHSPFGAGIYSSAWTERTYDECLRRAEQALFEGQRVLVDATFSDERSRTAFLQAAARLALPALLLLCIADPELVRQRLHARRGDASDADWSIYQEAARRWEEPGPLVRPALRSVPTSGTPQQALGQAARHLRTLSLLE